jgi:hypothetical protein
MRVKTRHQDSIGFSITRRHSNRFVLACLACFEGATIAYKFTIPTRTQPCGRTKPSSPPAALNSHLTVTTSHSHRNPQPQKHQRRARSNLKMSASSSFTSSIFQPGDTAAVAAALTANRTGMSPPSILASARFEPLSHPDPIQRQNTNQ